MSQDYTDIGLNSYGYKDVAISDKERSLLSPIDLDSMVASSAIGSTQIALGGIGTVNIADDAVTGDQLADGAVTSSTVNLAMRGWTLTSTFSATDYRIVAWAAGTFTASDGTSYSIGLGNTGNMAALTYIYLDIAVSTTALQTTTTATTAIGDGKVLLAVAQNNPDTTSKAKFQVFGGSGGNSIMVDNIVANSASTNEFVSNSAQLANLVVTNAKINDMSFSKAVGGTLTLGGSGNGNGVFSLKDSAGAEKIAMDNTGMTVSNGKIIIKDSSNTSIIDSTGLVSTSNFTFDSVSASGSTTRNSSDYADLDSMTLTTSSFTRDVKTLVLFTCNNRPSNRTDASDYTQFVINIDGTDQTQMPAYNLQYEGHSGYANFLSTSIQLVVTLGSGTHTIKVRWKSGGVGDAQTLERVLTYLVLGK